MATQTNRTEAAAELAARLTDPEQRARLLKYTCASPQTLWTWRSGQRIPGAHHRLIIQYILGIDASHWLTGPERRLVQRAFKASKAA